MPQLILLIVGAIVWGIIKALTQPPQKAPPGRQSARTTVSPVTPDREGQRSDPLSDFVKLFSAPPAVPPKARPQPAVMPQPAVRPQPEFRPQTVPAAPVIPETSEPDWLTTDSLVQGFIMAELLRPPLAKRPRRK